MSQETVYYAGRLGRVTSEFFELPGIRGPAHVLTGAWAGAGGVPPMISFFWGMGGIMVFYAVMAYLDLPQLLPFFSNEGLVIAAVVLGAPLWRLIPRNATDTELTVTCGAESFMAHVATVRLSVPATAPPRPVSELIGRAAWLKLTITGLTSHEVQAIGHRAETGTPRHRLRATL